MLSLMKKTVFFLAIMIFSAAAYSQSKEIIHLWPGKVPGELKEKQEPVIAPSKNDNVLRYSEVTDPVIEVWLPDRSKNKKAGVVVCPGGAYRILAYDKEGTEIAAWLNSLGYSAFVLKYRVPEKQEGALQDVQRAFRIIREKASEWNLDPEKLGVMGFSAGGSLSARAGTMYNIKTYQPVDKTDRLSCRPSFVLLIYPAYLDKGENGSLTPELKLTNDTPPVFIFQTADDFVGNSSVVMASAMMKAKLPVELHLLPKGGHGYGLRPGSLAPETWPLLAEKWLLRTLSGQ
jgi:acetyl esterase/lipase